MTTPTPGPWKLEHDWQEQPGAIIILSADNQIVADAWASRVERVANARLIASAPELLEAAQLVTDALTGYETFNSWGNWKILLEARKELAAAIAKAEGR
jgi:hypothetical protein